MDYFNKFLGKITDDDLRQQIIQDDNQFNNYDITNDPDLDYSLDRDPNFNNSIIEDPIDHGAEYMLANLRCKHQDPCISLIEKKHINYENKFNVPRCSDSKGEVILRISLEDGLTKTDLFNLITIVGDCSFKIIVGGSEKLVIQGLFLSMLLGKKLKKNIMIYKPKVYIEKEGKEKIKKDTFIEKNEYRVKITEKYTYYNINDTYLDIPIMEDFFSYGMNDQLISLQYHEVSYHFIIPKNKIDAFKTYVKGVSIYFNSLVYQKKDTRMHMVTSRHDYIVLQPYQQYIENCTQLSLKVRTNTTFIKFIFIILRPSPQVENDVDYTQLPTIERMTAITEYGNEFQYDPYNFWIMDFLKFRIIGIAADDTANMNNWEEFHKECLTFLEKNKKDFADKKNNESEFKTIRPDTNNIKNRISCNLNDKYNSKFRFHTFDHINITFTPYDIPISFQCFFMRQNIYSTRSGLGSYIINNY